MGRVLLLAAVALSVTARARVAGAAPLDDFAAATTACDPARARCFEIRLHVALDGDKSVVTAEWFAKQLAAANTHFAAADIAFELAGVDPLPASAAHVVTRADRDALGRGRTADVIHVYLVGTLDDVDVPGEARNGVAWRRRGDPSKYVILASRARPFTLAHELGHVFGLPHSKYAISIMNKTPRDQPPAEERTFAPEELEIIRSTAKHVRRAVPRPSTR
jgi:hypothetical protein